MNASTSCATTMKLSRTSSELTKEVQSARADLRRAKALLGTNTKDAYREAERWFSSAALPITSTAR